MAIAEMDVDALFSCAATGNYRAHLPNAAAAPIARGFDPQRHRIFSQPAFATECSSECSQSGAPVRRRKFSCADFIFAALLCGATSADATVYEEEALEAIVWLESHQSRDGSWGVDEAIKPIVTSEASAALRENIHYKPSYYKGITWLENHAAPNLDGLSRRAGTLAPHGDDLASTFAKFAESQHLADGELGGWGLSASYESSPIDTSLVLAALNGSSQGADALKAIDYLKVNQLGTSNDGWALPTQSNSDPVTTAIVVLGLQRNVGLDPSLPNVIDDAIAGLASTVTGSSSALARALSALAHLRGNSSSTTGLSLLNGLISSQLGSGSFADDAYLTALVLRAIAAANGTDAEELLERVHFPDIALHASITAHLSKNRLDGISQGEILGVTELTLFESATTDLTGLSVASNLALLNLTGTSVSSLSPLAGMTSLTQIVFQGQTLTVAGDADGDTLHDIYEVNLGLNPLHSDSDNDGLADNLESTHSTNPLDSDTDDDGLNDGDEVLVYLSDPLDTDTDGDALSDGDEVNTHETDPVLADTDGDFLEDGEEINTYETDPADADTDGGGRDDGDEVSMGREPLVHRDDIASDLAVIRRLFMR